MIVEIPTTSDSAHYSIEVNIEGVALSLTFDWLPASGYWYVSFGDTRGNLILGQQRLMGISDLTHHYSLSNFPKGVFIGINVVNPDRDAERETLGNDFKLFYMDFQDYVAILQ